MKKLFLLASIGVCEMSFSSESNTYDLNELLNTEITGASRYEQPLIESPNQAEVINRKDIAIYGYRTLGDALQSINGVHITNQRDYTYLGIRGQSSPGDYNSRMLLLSDGVRLNDPLYDSALIGHESPIDIDWIKRIEYMSGPGSSQYGANAVLGITNIITYSGQDLNGSKVTTELESYGRKKVTLLNGHSLGNGNDYIFGFSASNSSGADLYFPQKGWAQGLDGERYSKAYLKATIFNWQLTSGSSSRTKNIPTGYWNTTFNTPGTYNSDNYYYLNLSKQSDISPTLSQTIRLRYGKYDYAGHYNYTTTNSFDRGKSDWYGIDYGIDYRDFDNHRVTTGIELQQNNRLSQTNSDGSLNDSRRYINASWYAQDQWNINADWIQYVGLRLDRINERAAASPKWALVHRANTTTLARLSLSQAFRPANIYERFYDDSSGSGSIKSNPNLKNEYLRNIELNIDHAISATWLVQASIYYYKIDNRISQITRPDGLLQFINADQATGKGLELSSKYQTDDHRIKLSIATKVFIKVQQRRTYPN